MSQNAKIKENVMLASLNFSAWTGRRFDNRATATVENSVQIRKVGRFNKALMPGKPESFDAILKFGTNLREEFNKCTLEYQQLGVRLMPVSVYMEFAEKIRAKTIEYHRLVDTFIEEYPDIVSESQSRLGPLFLDEDYPDVFDLRKKFGIRFSVLPFPDAERFGVSLPEIELQRVRKEIEDHIDDSLKLAHLDLQRRLYEATLHLAQRVNSEGRLYNSSIENLREIITLLPKLNFTEDEYLTEIANRASRELTVFNADVLRTDAAIRADVGSKATEIAKNMSDYFDMPFDNSLLLDVASDPFAA
ncbi:hypothetical protein [Undibacterium oligocarboniphilum]|uniref:DUF3150 domain-containing protein n=1 Tax=Undibacterium oligocarboniphilum TaxID=666702 RepID=A0A850QIT3_9BURK|nr:hypothetical protein [Undibacterium oligocarboniphilum]MBC3871407.1 hypothetical protein [Undibacterium oligocarboniphilum]NVO79017.1 hypothetical protein [Undibacterium oligocarboniphilum]